MIGVIMLFLLLPLGIWWLNDGAYNAASRANDRKHFSRPGLSMATSGGKLVKFKVIGDDRPHDVRCQTALQDWYKIEQRLRWYPAIYFALMIYGFIVTPATWFATIVLIILLRLLYATCRQFWRVLKAGPEAFRKELENE